MSEEKLKPSLTVKKPKLRLTPKQHQFCLLYATSSEHFGNATTAYAKAYSVDLKKKGGYKVAQGASSRLLSNVIILKRIEQLLDDGPMTDDEADKHLAYWMRQRLNPQASVTAIREYNALKQRIIKKIELKTADPVGEALSKLGLGDQMDAGQASVPTSKAS